MTNSIENVKGGEAIIRNTLPEDIPK